MKESLLLEFGDQRGTQSYVEPYSSMVLQQSETQFIFSLMKATAKLHF
jgi:hypothetical protein